MNSCPSCGAALPQAAVRFCLNCGHRLTSEGQQAASPPEAPPGTDPVQPRSRRQRRPAGSTMIIALVALAILAAGGIGAYALIHDNSHASAAPIHHRKLADSTPTPTLTAASPAPSAEQNQLQQFLGVIRQSASARTLVKAAMRQIGVCAMTPAGGITQLQQAITERQNALATLGRLQVSAIPGGQGMRTSLGDVLQLSIAADRDFTAWMQDPRTTRHCPASTAQDAHYAAGVQTSAQAMQAKQQFLSQWNGMAGQYGLPTFSTLDI